MTLLGLLRKTLRLGAVAGVFYGVWKTVQSRRSRPSWESDSWVSTGGKGPTVPAAAPTLDLSATNSPSEPAAPTPPAAESAQEPGTASLPEPAPAAPGRPPKPTAGTGPGRKGVGGRSTDEPPGERRWVPASEGVCPPSHPIKAKLASKIFHVPGGRNYARTRADRCYPDADSAQTDGLRPALR